MPHTAIELPPLYSSLSTEPILCEMVELFVEEMPGRVERMRSCFEARNWDGLRRAVHQLNGVAASYGFDALIPCAVELEAILMKRTRGEEIGQALDALVAQCGRVSANMPR